MILIRFYSFFTSLLMISLVCLGGYKISNAEETNFSRDVATSIDAGLQWFVNLGAFTNPGSIENGRSAGLIVLTLLEKRVSADQYAEVSGYSMIVTDFDSAIQFN